MEGTVGVGSGSCDQRDLERRPLLTLNRSHELSEFSQALGAPISRRVSKSSWRFYPSPGTKLAQQMFTMSTVEDDKPSRHSIKCLYVQCFGGCFCTRNAITSTFFLRPPGLRATLEAATDGSSGGSCVLGHCSDLRAWHWASTRPSYQGMCQDGFILPGHSPSTSLRVPFFSLQDKGLCSFKPQKTRCRSCFSFSGR